MSIFLSFQYDDRGGRKSKAKLRTRQQVSTDEEYPSDDEDKDQGRSFKSSRGNRGPPGGRRKNRNSRSFAKSPMPLQQVSN